jgi:hypothetical protein
MPRFRQRPHEIEAVRWTGSAGSTKEVREFIGTTQARDGKHNTFTPISPMDAYLWVIGLKDWVVIKKGDWVVRSSIAGVYRIESEAFADGYELVSVDHVEVLVGTDDGQKVYEVRREDPSLVTRGTKTYSA